MYFNIKCKFPATFLLKIIPVVNSIRNQTLLLAATLSDGFNEFLIGDIFGGIWSF